jgi:hypothetical protein
MLRRIEALERAKGLDRRARGQLAPPKYSNFIDTE